MHDPPLGELHHTNHTDSFNQILIEPRVKKEVNVKEADYYTDEMRQETDSRDGVMQNEMSDL